VSQNDPVLSELLELRADVNEVRSREYGGTLSVFNVRDYGARGNGATDDTAAFTAIIAAAGAGDTVFVPNGTYKVTTGFFIRKAISIVGNGGSKINLVTGGSLVCPTTFWFQSAMDSNSADHPYYGPGGGVTYYRTFTGALSGGEHTFTLGSVTGLAIGTHCMLLLGVDPYDATQPFMRMWNQVTNIAGSAVTFTLPIPDGINGTSHKCVTFDAIVENIRIADIRLAYDGTASQDQSLYIDKCRNVVVENVVIESCHSAVTVEASENVSLTNILAWKVDTESLLNAFGCTDCRANNLRVMDCWGEALNFETQNRGFIVDGVDIGRGPTANNGTYAISVSGQSTGIVIKNITLNFDIDTLGMRIVENSKVQTENVLLYRHVRIFPLGQHRGSIYNGVNGSYYGGDLKRWSRLFALWNGRALDIGLPSGVWKSVRIFTTDTANLTQFTFGGGIGDIKAQLSAGNMVRPTSAEFTTLSLSSDYPFNNTDAKATVLQVGAGVAAGAYGVIEVEYWPGMGDDDNTQGMIQATEALH
jgi:hypothetical protein